MGSVPEVGPGCKGEGEQAGEREEVGMGLAVRKRERGDGVWIGEVAVGVMRWRER